MKTFLRRLMMTTAILIAVLTLQGALVNAAGLTPGACVSLDDRATTGLSDRWASALAAGSAEDAAALYAEDAVILADGRREPIKGRGQIRAYLSLLAKRHADARFAMRSVMTGCGLVSEMSAVHFQVTGERKGTRMFIGGRTATTYAFQDGAWLIIQQSLPTMTVPNRAK